MKKKKKEPIKKFMNRRNKETGKVTIPETKPSPSFSAGSHKTKALSMHVGVVKKKTAKMLERTEKKKKKNSLYDVFN